MYFKHEDPDIFCLQETKCDEESLPKEMQLEGYHAFWSSAEKKGYAGTGLFSKVKPIEVTYGLGGFSFYSISSVNVHLKFQHDFEHQL